MSSIFILILCVGVVLGAVALGLILQRRRRLRVAVDQALDADELDFDRRLGRLQFLDFPEGKIAYRQIGQGADLLCLHGIGASMIIYRRLVPLLAHRYRVTCLDFPGFGWSDKPHVLSYELDPQASTLDAAMRALKLERPLVIASSMGAAIALASLTKRPWARALIAMAPATDPHRIPKFLLPVAANAERLQPLLISTRLTVRAVLYKTLARHELITPGLVDAYFRPFKAEPAASAAFLKALRLLGDPRMPRLFQTLAVPLVVMHGKRDHLVSLNACKTLCAIVPGATLIAHPTAGHHIMEDEPEWSAAQIEAYDRTYKP